MNRQEKAPWWARRGLLTVLITGTTLTAAAGQQTEGRAPTIDTVIVHVTNVFAPEQSTTIVARAMNGIHFPTKPYVVRQFLSFEAGDPYDPRIMAESERDLRSLGLFTSVTIDTTRVDGRLAAEVRVQDGWSTSPTIGFAATGGTITWALGLTESNLFGTGNMVSAIYRQETDREGLTLGGEFKRIAGTQIDIDGNYSNWSDGTVATWTAGDPFRSEIDPRSIQYLGGDANRRLLQYRTVTTLDTTIYRENAFLARINAAHARNASTERYLRLGGMAQFITGKIVLLQDSGMAVPDTSRGAFGLTGDYQVADYKVAEPQFNGFGPQEDLDLSFQFHLGLWLAPSAFGYDQTGLGPELILKRGVGTAHAFFKGALTANGLFSGAGLDSGRVDVSATVGFRLGTKNWDLLYVAAGAQQNPPPGQEYDMGAGAAGNQASATFPPIAQAQGFIGPRLFPPHSFTGTRSIWGTYEHRLFLLTDIVGYFGLGLAAFFDYGGAWYPDQDARFGGNVGVGLRFGSIHATTARLVRLDIGYQFGDGVADKGLVVGFGQGFVY